MRTAAQDFETVMRTIFKRCVDCEDAPLQCPVCAESEICTLRPKSCDACSSMVCIPSSTIDPDASNDEPAESQGPNIGAIAGGVIGGIVFIAIATFVVWKFCIKGRRQEYDESEWDQSDLPLEKRQSEFTMRRDARMSTHTVASMASTVLTRASNIIQIAYIPGITNRSGPQSPDLLVPPVPPIPIAVNGSTPSSPYSSHDDPHYFMPGDLHSIRDSTYSGYSDDVRSSFHTRASITPSLARSSVATTIYRNDAVVNPMPAQTVLRGKAAVVSVKSGGSGSPVGTPSPGTPPVPSIEFAQAAQRPTQVRMPSNTSLRSTGQGSVVSTATSAKPIPVTITKKKPSLISMSSSSSLGSATASPRPNTVASAVTEPDNGDEETSRERQSLINPRDSNVTEIADTPSTNQSPFSDMSATITSPDFHPRSFSRLGALDTVDEDDEHNKKDTVARSRSPFGDEHAVK